MWWLSIVADCAVGALAVWLCIVSYRKTYGREGSERLGTLRAYEKEHGKLYAVTTNFQNYFGNILVKLGFTAGCIVLIHCTKTMWITILYVALVALSLYTYIGRCINFSKLDSATKEAARPAQRAALAVPLCHLVFGASLYLCYLLELWYPA